MNPNQKAELRAAWNNRKGVSNLDYVTGWQIKTLNLLEDRRGTFAFVTTSSIAQGQSVPILFGAIFDAGWRIKFAHRPFAWDSEALGKAAVHCVIIGFTRDHAVKQRLWEYERPDADPVEVPVKTGVNAYLVDGPNVLVGESEPLSPLLPAISLGSMPNDGRGNLLIKAEAYEAVMKDPIAAKYVRPFRNGKELVHGLDRWCLWLVDADPADIEKSALLKERVQGVARARRASRRPGTQKLAQTPSLFGENRQPETDYLGIPAVVSETRKFYTVAYLEAEVIAGNKLYPVPGDDGFLFALMSSSMFITWQKAIGGRLESRLNFSNKIVWNNFPVPELTEKQQTQIIVAGKKVLEARELHPERSLADHYDSEQMSEELLAAHAELDQVVDIAFGADHKLTSEVARLELLFKNYLKLTQEH